MASRMSSTVNSLATNPPVGLAFEQAFLRQPVKHQAQWGAGNVQARGQWHLAQPFAGRKRVPQV